MLQETQNQRDSKCPLGYWNMIFLIASCTWCPKIPSVGAQAYSSETSFPCQHRTQEHRTPSQRSERLQTQLELAATCMTWDISIYVQSTCPQLPQQWPTHNTQLAHLYSQSVLCQVDRRRPHDHQDDGCKDLREERRVWVLEQFYILVSLDELTQL